MAKKLLAGTFGVLIVILGIAVWMRNQNVSMETYSNSEIKEEGKNIELPIARDNPNVGSVLLHYFITGVLKEVKTTDGKTVLILKNSSGLPEILLQPQTRISRITPPYESNTPIPLSVKDLRAGMNIDISMEYNVGSKSWATSDVFIATDKN